MYQLDKGKDMLGCVFPSSEAAVADEDDDNKAVTSIETENPVAVSESAEDEEADQE
eukprot:COSAG06_NODE_16858_length_977_cov_0.796128_2_plen_56_part_00